MAPWIALAIFIVTCGAIASDRVDRTLAALLGAVAVILVGIVTQEAGFAAVDWNVIFLLFGMMVLAGVLRRTGVFGWLAIRTVRVARGEPLAILLLLAGDHRAAQRVPRQRHHDRPARARDALHRHDAAALPDPVRPGRGARLEHRGYRHPDRRPAEHPHRVGQGAGSSGSAAWWPCSRCSSPPPTSGFAILSRR